MKNLKKWLSVFPYAFIFYLTLLPYLVVLAIAINYLIKSRKHHASKAPIEYHGDRCFLVDSPGFDVYYFACNPK
jgi:hypothetical protein